MYTNRWIYVSILFLSALLSSVGETTASNDGSGEHRHQFLENPIVTVNEGQLKGSLNTLINGGKYYSFKGIPYAEPPVGKLRFTAPRPPNHWEGIRDALEHGPVCPQVNDITNSLHEGSEDCLFINVYSKNLSPQAKTPVLVYIHGGGFKFGSGNSDMYSPDFLLQHDLVFVTFNYRLEVMGFLSLDTPEVPGNAGMKDQVFALRWVQKNIAQFGGDSDRVTIYGESAGSAAVTYHLLSPMSKGLFHRAITQSGDALADWSLNNNAKERSFRLGKALGRDTNDTDDLLQFFRQIPALDLVNVTLLSTTEDETRRGLYIHFVPAIEKKFPNVEAFMTEKAIDALTNGHVNKVPLIAGYNSAEVIFFFNNESPRIILNNNNSSYYVPRTLSEQISQEKLIEFGKRIKEFYVGDGNFTHDNPKPIIDVVGDKFFLYPTHRFINLYTNFDVPVYMYRFNFDTDLNIAKKMAGLVELDGASHTDDWYYFFLMDSNKKPYIEQKNIRDLVFYLTKTWADFAKYGCVGEYPGTKVVWPPYTKAGKEYLKLEEVISVGHYADKERMEFWNQLFKEAGLPHIV